MRTRIDGGAAALAALALTLLLTTRARAQDDVSVPLPEAAAAQLDPSTQPDAPVPPDIVPTPHPEPDAGRGSVPPAEAGPGIESIEGALDSEELPVPGSRQRPNEPAMTVARVLSNLMGCFICTPLGTITGMLAGMLGYSISLAAASGRTIDLDWALGYPFFGLIGASIGGALAAPLGTLAGGAMVDIARPVPWALGIAAGAGLLGTAIPVGVGIGLYVWGSRDLAAPISRDARSVQVVVLAPVVMAAGIPLGGLAALLAYDVSYPLLGAE